MTPGEELLFLALGGSGEIGMNVNLYGCRGKWLMADCGLTFADPQYPGIDLILPDLEFIEQRAKDLIGIVLTHGHEDHIGALPYMAADLKVPLYANPFTAGLIAGNAAVLTLNFSQANIAGINIGLIALLLNFVVTFAVSAVAKNDSSPAPLATSRRMEERRTEGRTV